MSSTTLLGSALHYNSDICKLWLLICKNVSVQRAHPLSTTVILFAPVLLFLYTQIDQLVSDKKPDEVSQTRHPPIELDIPNITSILYSPTNNVLEGVISEVASNLGSAGTEAFLYAADLEVALIQKDGFVGIEFEDKLRNIMEIPSKVKIALRFPLHLRTKGQRMWPNRLYRPLVERTEKGFYNSEGFLIIQAKLSEALMRARNESAHIPQVLMQPFPDNEQKNYAYLLPLYNSFIMHFAFMFLGPSLIIGQQIVAEKQRQLREIMRIMGLTVGLNWLSWFIVASIMYAVPMFVIVVLMKFSLCPSSSFLLLLFIFAIYLLTLICFTFMISAFLTSSIMAMTTITIMHVISFLPYLLIGIEPTKSKSVIICFFLNSAMPSIFVQLLGFEIRGVGAQWNTLFQYSHPDDKLSIGAILLILMASNIFRLICCCYADQLNPGETGVAKKWYFPFRRKFWCPWERPRHGLFRIDEERETARARQYSTIAFEEVTHNKAVIMEAQRLCKVFGDNEAVSDLSLKFYEDEITVLLGHNGAGKTTTFMMLAGMTSPTSGRVLINGHNMATSTQKARESLSICLQYNVLFEELSAHWHIVFYSQLKGFRKPDAEVEAERYLELMDLMDKATMKVKSLSSGMRRKLSICCALCANTKVVLCDEPTACLDPSARREVWDLLRMEKTGRCIVMNTHFMEAAEVLGDRIAIMCDGQLYGYGTSEYIIKNLGPGYRLVCEAQDDCDVLAVTKFLEQRFENIELENVVGSDITYRLPLPDIYKYTSLFRALEYRLAELKLVSFGVSAPTLGETFIKISAEKITRQRTEQSLELVEAWMSQPNDIQERSSWKRFSNDWHGMMLKKALYTWHHPFLFSLIMLLPLLGVGLPALLDLVTQKKRLFEVNLYDLAMYPGAKVLRELLVTGSESSNEIFIDNSKAIADEYENVAMGSGATVRTIEKISIEDFLLKNLNVDEEGFNRTYVAGITFREGSATAWFNRRLEHGAPMSLGLIYKAIAYVLVKMDIEIINKPRADSDSSVYNKDNTLSAMKRTSFVLIYLCFAIAAFVLLPVQERVSRMKHQQVISGIRLSTYWLSHMLWDFATFMLIIISVLLALYKEAGPVLYWLAILLFVFGFSALAFTYLLSFLFKEPGSGMSYTLVINCIIVFIAIYMTPHENDEFYKYLHYILLTLPYYAMYFATLAILRYGQEASNCESLDLGCVCEGVAQPIRIYSELIYLAVSWIVFFVLLLLTSKVMTLRYAFKRRGTSGLIEDEDPYISNARRQVDEIVKDEDELKSCSLVCDRVNKKYRRLLAVNCVSLKISPYECFGLMGLNGAGKTSTVDMIVGNQMISGGNIYVEGNTAKGKLKKCLQHIGFCPQNNTMWSFMTGRQMLKFTCLTSGINRSFIKFIIAHLAECFVLTNHLDMKTKYYSVGTSRKLNLAMAVLSRSLLCLDEPTTGVDISAKQEIWLVLNDLREQGRSLLLTSHNMQECEAICTCVAIMVNGTIRCIGSVQELRNRYNRGISVKIQLATNAEMEDINFLRDSTENSNMPSQQAPYAKENESVQSRRESLAKVNDSDLSQSPTVSPRYSQQGTTSKGTQAHLKKKKTRARKPTTPLTPKSQAPQSLRTPTPGTSPSVASLRPSIHRVTERTMSLRSIRSNGSPRRTESWKMGSETYSFSDAYEYWALIKNVERQLALDFPTSYVTEKYTYRGMVTITIPDSELKWSIIFRYMEEHRNELQIKHYSISQTSLEDIFMEFANQQNTE